MNMDLAIMKGIREKDIMEVEEVVVVTSKEGLVIVVRGFGYGSGRG